MILKIFTVLTTIVCYEVQASRPRQQQTFLEESGEHGKDPFEEGVRDGHMLWSTHKQAVTEENAEGESEGTKESEP